jgi:hypothetical protein
MWALETLGRPKPQPAVQITLSVSPAWAARRCETTGRPLMLLRRATRRPAIQLSPRDFAVVTSHPIQVECPEREASRRLLFAWGKTRNAVLSLSREMPQCLDQFASVASKKPGMRCNQLDPNDGHEQPWHIDPLSNSSAPSAKSRKQPHSDSLAIGIVLQSPFDGFSEDEVVLTPGASVIWYSP